MADDLDLSVPTEYARRKATPSGGSNRALLVLMIVLLAGSIALQLTRTGPYSSDPPTVSPDTEKRVALKLEERDLWGPAAEAWTRYLASKNLSDEQRAKIHYRLGTLYARAEQYENALDALYRSEETFRIASLEQEMKELLARIEKGLLADRVIQKEFERDIRIDEGDLRNYYAAHQAEFTDAESEEEPAKPKAFEEVRNQVAQALVGRKRQEIQTRLLSQLREKYNVVIHHSKFQSK